MTVRPAAPQQKGPDEIIRLRFLVDTGGSGMGRIAEFRDPERFVGGEPYYLRNVRQEPSFARALALGRR